MYHFAVNQNFVPSLTGIQEMAGQRVRQRGMLVVAYSGFFISTNTTTRTAVYINKMAPK